MILLPNRKSSNPLNRCVLFREKKQIFQKKKKDDNFLMIQGPDRSILTVLYLCILGEANNHVDISGP